MTDYLKDLYYDPKHGYVSLDKLYRKVKEDHPDVTRKQIQEFLESQYTYQVNKETKKPRTFNSIIAPEPRSNYQMDILVYNRYEIHNYKYILCVIDVHSRYVSAVAMTNRENKTIVQRLNEIFKKMGPPKNMNCDNEFNTQLLLGLFRKHKITPHFSDVGEINKNAIVERFNRTLANLLQKWRVATHGTTWYKVLPDLVENYNSTYHTTIKAKPVDVFEGKAKNKQTITRIAQTLAVGDLVRLKQAKAVLGKGDYIKYSEDPYIITSMKGKKYYVKNTRTEEAGGRPYEEYELKKVSDIVHVEPPAEEVQEEAPPTKAVSDAKEAATLARRQRMLEREMKKLQEYLVTPKRDQRKVSDYFKKKT